MSDGARQQGFTLVEVLIALAIVAAMTALLAGTVAQDARIRDHMRDRREALVLAQSALANADDAGAGERGEWGRYSWQVARQPFGSADPLDLHPLEQITVSVMGQDRREIVHLDALRIKP